MSNPWLNVPLTDYEAHMQSADVRQLSPLSDLFAQALKTCSPKTVAVLGVAGGNGLEHIDSGVTERVCGIDINPEYLEITRNRFSDIKGLELHCADLEANDVLIDPVQMVHAALIFEHAGLEQCLENATRMVSPQGYLAVVLQREAKDPADNLRSNSRASIESLRGHFRLISPADLLEKLKQKGFQDFSQTYRNLPSGKAFWMGIFLKEG